MNLSNTYPYFVLSISGSFTDGTGSIIKAVNLTASNVNTASYSNKTISSSYALTASYAITSKSNTPSTILITGSTYPITSSWSNKSVSSTTSSYSLNTLTASYALNCGNNTTSSSNGITGGFLSGTSSIADGNLEVAVTGLNLPSIPKTIIFSIRMPNPLGEIVYGNLDNSSITTNGFSVYLSGIIDGNGYILDYVVTY